MIDIMIEDELGNLDTSDEGESDGFNPLGKVFSSKNDKFMAIG